MMAQVVIRAVYFDFYGTVAAAAAWPETPDAVLARHGHGLPQAVRDGWAREALAGLDHHAHSGSRERYLAWDRRRVAELVAACGVPPDSAPVILDELWKAKRPPALLAYPEARGVLLELRALGFVVGLCSNWDWDLDVDIDRLGLADCFDVVVSSARAGARKPHPRIYGYALAQIGLPAEEVLFVGDAIVPDVTGPTQAGMRAAYLRRAFATGWAGLGAEQNGCAPLADLPAGVPLLADLCDVLALVAPR